jgi:hypothetical protein
MCTENERELAAKKGIDYMEEMKHVPPFEWLDGKIPTAPRRMRILRSTTTT